jgi:hypothetical protein
LMRCRPLRTIQKRPSRSIILLLGVFKALKCYEITYLLLNNFQLDISGGVDLSEAAGDWFVAAVFSYRPPR